MLDPQSFHLLLGKQIKQAPVRVSLLPLLLLLLRPPLLPLLLLLLLLLLVCCWSAAAAAAAAAAADGLPGAGGSW
jgi:hypothetical protein